MCNTGSSGPPSARIGAYRLVLPSVAPSLYMTAPHQQLRLLALPQLSSRLSASCILLVVTATQLHIRCRASSSSVAESSAVVFTIYRYWHSAPYTSQHLNCTHTNTNVRPVLGIAVTRQLSPLCVNQFIHGFKERGKRVANNK